MPPNYERSWEHLSTADRRAKIAAHISDLRIGDRVLREAGLQSEAIQEFEARSYQLDAFNALWAARNDGAERGLVHLATGLGKTSVAVVDYAAFRQQHTEATGQEPRALFVVHQNNILQQASERFEQLLPEATQSFYSSRQKKLPESNVTFASFQTLRNSAHRLPADYFDYIIYDEAHHIEADTYKKVVEHFTPAFQLGLTATPERMDEKDITDHFGQALYAKTLPEAIAEKHLATVNYNIIFDDAVKEAMDNGFEPSSLAEIQRLFEVQPRNEVIAEMIRDAQNLIRANQGVDVVKTIVFCADIEHADSIADILQTESYHSKKDDAEQAALLSAFRTGDLETITVRNMFNEGVDIPDARLIVFLRTTQSPTIFEQQLGRGLRKSKNKDEVTVLDFVANIDRIALIRELEKKIGRVRRSQNTDQPIDGRDAVATTSSISDGEIKIHGEYSEFIFSQEMVDLLERYDSLQIANREQKMNRDEWSALTDEELVARARELSPDGPIRQHVVRQLSSENKFMTIDQINRRFGDLTQFHYLCGYRDNELHYVAPLRDWKHVSAEEIVKIALELSPETPLTRRGIDEFAKQRLLPGRGIINRLFGSIPEFQRACGYEVTEKRDYTNTSPEDVVEIAKSFSPDAPLQVKDIERLSKERVFPSLIVIQRMFGSVTAFQVACGFEVKQKIAWAKLTRQEIVDLALSLSPDKPLNTSSINDLNKTQQFPHSNLITKVFGTIREFQQACGFKK